MIIRQLLIVVVALAAAACLNIREEITVHEDGSLTVRIIANGNPWDFANGYPLPTGSEWRPSDAETARWVSLMVDGDPSEWSPPEFVPDPAKPDAQPHLELSVSGQFGDASELPERFAPASDPYTEQFQRRSTTLQTRRVGGRTVYVFERVFHRLDPVLRTGKSLVHERLDKVLDPIREKDGPVSVEDWELVVEALRDAFEAGAQLISQEAMAALYTEGDASLNPTEAVRIAAHVGQAVRDGFVTADVVEYHRAREAGELTPDAADPAEIAVDAARVVMRSTLASQLDGAGVEWGVRNAILARAEALIAGWDHADDLDDDGFDVVVTMPGTVVGGNHAKRDGNTVSWNFKGETLLDGSRVLRVVSVVE